MIKIGVDIDGTIKYTQRAAVQVFNEALDRQVKVEDIRSFYLDEAYGLTAKEGKKLWRKLESKIYAKGLPREYAAAVLMKLAETGHLIYFITARPGMPHIRKVTESWLQKHDFPFNGENLFMSAQDKAKVAQELGIDLFFEDAPAHLDRLTAAGIPTVIVDAVYNRDYDADVPRITDWADVVEMVRSLDRNQCDRA